MLFPVSNSFAFVLFHHNFKINNSIGFRMKMKTAVLTEILTICAA